jgi:hypothetical protein
MCCDTEPHVLSDSSYDTDLAASSDSNIDSSMTLNHIHPFSYDVDDPCIEVGVMFLDVK